MAISKGEYQKKRTHVHEIFVDSENVGKELDEWYYENEPKCNVLDVKISSCLSKDMQSKTVVLIFYRYKLTDGKDN